MGSADPNWQPQSGGELLLRYDVAGPRYTSYPTAPQFRPDFGEMRYREHARRGNATFTPRPLSLYVHIPFCASPCFYCGCNRLITRDVTAGSRYVERLLREAALVAPLFDHHREVRQLHLGGGTPNFLSQSDLTRLIKTLTGDFRLGDTECTQHPIELWGEDWMSVGQEVGDDAPAADDTPLRESGRQP